MSIVSAIVVALFLVACYWRKLPIALPLSMFVAGCFALSIYSSPVDFFVGAESLSSNLPELYANMLRAFFAGLFAITSCIAVFYSVNLVMAWFLSLHFDRTKSSATFGGNTLGWTGGVPSHGSDILQYAATLVSISLFLHYGGVGTLWELAYSILQSNSGDVAFLPQVIELGEVSIQTAFSAFFAILMLSLFVDLLLVVSSKLVEYQMYSGTTTAIKFCGILVLLISSLYLLSDRLGFVFQEQAEKVFLLLKMTGA